MQYVLYILGVTGCNKNTSLIGAQSFLALELYKKNLKLKELRKTFIVGLLKKLITVPIFLLWLKKGYQRLKILKDFI